MVGVWVRNLLLSLLLGCLVGGLGYLVARALTTAYLLQQQQQFVQATVGLVQGGSIEDLGGSNLREQRQRVEALAARYRHYSVQTGLGLGALAALGCYLWLERAATSAPPGASNRSSYP